MENCSLSNVTYLVDNLSKFDQDTNMDNEYGAEVNLPHGFSNERQEELQERLTCNQQPTGAEDEHDGGDKSTIECIKTVLDLSVENISKKRQSLDSVAQVVREFFPLAKLLVLISMCFRQLFSSSLQTILCSRQDVAISVDLMACNRSLTTVQWLTYLKMEWIYRQP